MIWGILELVVDKVISDVTIGANFNHDLEQENEDFHLSL